MKCGAGVLPTEKPSSCTSCGGDAVRAFPGYCCPRCGEAIGYLGRALEWAVGKTHECIDAGALTATTFKPHEKSNGDS